MEGWLRPTGFGFLDSKIIDFGRQGKRISFSRYRSYLVFGLIEENGIQKSILVDNKSRSGHWLHFAMIHERGQIRLILNGRDETTRTDTSRNTSAHEDEFYYIGGSFDTIDRTLSGQLDEIRIWNHARSTQEIDRDLFKSLSGRERGLLALWDFDESNADDSTINGYHGTL